jgi:hypothetical protein
MNLYIETENGKPKNHPAFEDNLIQAFGIIPDHWVPFERVECPNIDVYEVLESEIPNYELIGSVYKDVWKIRQMTIQEITTKKLNAITDWNNHFPSWIFNENKCAFESPVPYPQDDKRYYWDESTINWVEVINEQIT